MSEINSTTCKIQRPVWGQYFPAPQKGNLHMANGQQTVGVQALPFFDRTHKFAPIPGEDYCYFCVYCLGRVTEADYTSIVSFEIAQANAQSTEGA